MRENPRAVHSFHIRPFRPSSAAACLKIPAALRTRQYRMHDSSALSGEAEALGHETRRGRFAGAGGKARGPLLEFLTVGEVPIASVSVSKVSKGPPDRCRLA